MEPFEINLVGQVLTVQPRLDSAYDIFDGSEKLGTIRFEAADAGTRWVSDELNADFAKQIGELIDEHKL